MARNKSSIVLLSISAVHIYLGEFGAFYVLPAADLTSREVNVCYERKKKGSVGD